MSDQNNKQASHGCLGDTGVDAMIALGTSSVKPSWFPGQDQQLHPLCSYSILCRMPLSAHQNA